jgi:XTP/dITP diphosphohydrolase
MELILSTRNPSKAAEIKRLLAGAAIRVRTLEDAGIEGEVEEETGEGATLEGNSRLKAAFARRHAPADAWVAADDTGFFVDAFGGEPGVDAAFWGGDLSTEARAAYCLERMEGLEDRAASFRTTVVLIAPDGAEHVFSGELRGTVLEKAARPPLPKMPYSGIFLPEGGTRCLADIEESGDGAEHTHRGRAFIQARAFLERQEPR